MYGTVARLRIKPGAEGKLAEQMRAFEAAMVPGVVATYVYRMDAAPPSATWRLCGRVERRTLRMRPSPTSRPATRATARSWRPSRNGTMGRPCTPSRECALAR
jgi:hypothetical protein